jgi:glycosyltransferase involved in cell wall biosynthesis
MPEIDRLKRITGCFELEFVEREVTPEWAMNWVFDSIWRASRYRIPSRNSHGSVSIGEDAKAIYNSVNYCDRCDPVVPGGDFEMPDELILPRTLLVHNKIMPYRVPIFERLIDRYGVDLFVFNDDVPETFAHPGAVSTGDRTDLLSRLWTGDYEVVVNPDIVFGEAHIDGVFALLRSLGVVQWTETWAMPDRNYRQRLRTATLLRLADLYVDQYIVPGTASAVYVSKLTGTTRSDIHQIGNPTHVGLDETDSDETDTTDSGVVVTDDVPVVLFLGQVIERKGLDILLDAVARIDDDIDYQVLIGGTGAETYRDRLDDQIQQAGLENVSFLGWVPEETMFAQYQAADIYVLPSRADPWPLSVVEAMKAGTPVVVSDAVGTGWDLVDGQETGYVFPSEDADVLAARLERLLRDPDCRAAMGERAAELVRTHVTYDRMERQICEAICRAAGDTPTENGTV